MFRIFVCLWTFRDLYHRSIDFEAFHCDTGLLDDESMTYHGFWLHRLLFYRGSVMIQFILFLLHFIITLCVLFCYKLHISTILHFLFTISIHERNPYIIDGGDRLFRHLSFWLILLPTYHYSMYLSSNKQIIDKNNKNNKINNTINTSSQTQKTVRYHIFLLTSNFSTCV